MQHKILKTLTLACFMATFAITVSPQQSFAFYMQEAEENEEASEKETKKDDKRGRKASEEEREARRAGEKGERQARNAEERAERGERKAKEEGIKLIDVGHHSLGFNIVKLIKQTGIMP